MSINLILAINSDNAIGNDNKLLYFFAEDLKRFVNHTKNTTIVMGKNTWLSLPKKLPNRRNIVLTSSNDIWCPIKEVLPDEIIHSIDDIIKISSYSDVWIIGGAKLYMDLIEIADRVELTYINDSNRLADSYVYGIEDKLKLFNLIKTDTIEDIDKLTNKKYSLSFKTYVK